MRLVHYPPLRIGMKVKAITDIPQGFDLYGLVVGVEEEYFNVNWDNGVSELCRHEEIGHSLKVINETK